MAPYHTCYSVNFQRNKAFVGLSDYRTFGLSDCRTIGRTPIICVRWENGTLIQNPICFNVIGKIILVEFEDTKGTIRIRESKKKRQHNRQNKKYKRINNDLQNINNKTICTWIIGDYSQPRWLYFYCSFQRWKEHDTSKTTVYNNYFLYQNITFSNFTNHTNKKLLKIKEKLKRIFSSTKCQLPHNNKLNVNFHT